MAMTLRAPTLSEALSRYAGGEMALDELVGHVTRYPFKAIVVGEGWPQEDTVEEVIAYWQAGHIPDADYEELLTAILEARGYVADPVLGAEGKARAIYNPDARDADMDRIVQEGTPFARPARPRVPTPAASSGSIFTDIDKVEGFARDTWEMDIPATDGSGTFHTVLRRLTVGSSSREYPGGVADVVPGVRDPRDRTAGPEVDWSEAVDIMDSDTASNGPSGHPVQGMGEVLFEPADGGPTRRVGFFDEHLSPERLNVHHEFIELVPTAQGKGFATTWNEHAAESYREAGFKTETLMAGMTGAYVWALAGYDYAPSEFGEEMPGTQNQVMGSPYVYEGLDYMANDEADDDPPGAEGWAPEVLAEARALSKRAWADGESGAAMRSVTPYEIAMLGKDHPRSDGKTFGYVLMEGNTWNGVREL